MREKDERKSNELEGSVRQSEDVLGLGWIEFSSGGEQAGGRECKRRYLTCVLYAYGLITRYTGAYFQAPQHLATGPISVGPSAALRRLSAL